MMVANKFVFLHLHKSGGTFVNQMIASCIPYARQVGYHFPYKELPRSFARLPVVGTVRNPWDYYVSWYHFQLQMDHPHPLFMCVSKGNTLDFEQTILNLVSISKDDELFNDFQQKLPDNYQRNGINLTKECFEPHRASEFGFYSFLYNRLYQGASEPIIIKMEQLRDGLTNLVEQLQLQPHARINAFLQDAPKINTSKHQKYQSYYSNKLKECIASADGELIEQHSYMF